MGVGVVRIESIFYTCERATCIDASESFYLRTHLCLIIIQFCLHRLQVVLCCLTNYVMCMSVPALMFMYIGRH